MPIYEPVNLTSGIDDAIVSTVTAVPQFIYMFLIFIYFTVMISGFNSERRRTGSASLPLWSTIASLATLLTTMPLTLITGIVQLEVLSIVIVVTIFSGLWLFLDKGRGEF